MNKKLFTLLLVGAVGGQTAQLNAWYGSGFFKTINALTNPFDFSKPHNVPAESAKYALVKDNGNDLVEASDKSAVGWSAANAAGLSVFTPLDQCRDTDNNDIDNAGDVKRFFDANYKTIVSAANGKVYYVYKAVGENNVLQDAPRIDNDNGTLIVTKNEVNQSLEEVGSNKIAKYDNRENTIVENAQIKVDNGNGTNNPAKPFKEVGTLADLINGTRLKASKKTSAGIISAGYVTVLATALTAYSIGSSYNNEEEEEEEDDEEDDKD